MRVFLLDDHEIVRHRGWVPVGDPMEAAIDTFARRLAGVDGPMVTPTVVRRHAFDPSRRRESVLVEGALLVKGAPDAGSRDASAARGVRRRLYWGSWPTGACGSLAVHGRSIGKHGIASVAPSRSERGALEAGQGAGRWSWSPGKRAGSRGGFGCDDDDGAGGVMGDVVDGRAEQQAGEATAAACADDQQIGVFGCFEQDVLAGPSTTSGRTATSDGRAMDPSALARTCSAASWRSSENDDGPVEVAR